MFNRLQTVLEMPWVQRFFQQFQASLTILKFDAQTMQEEVEGLVLNIAQRVQMLQLMAGLNLVSMAKHYQGPQAVQYSL